MKRLTGLLFILALLNNSLIGQIDTTFYFASNMKLVNENEAFYAKSVKYKNNGRALISNLKRNKKNQWTKDDSYQKVTKLNEITYKIETYQGTLVIESVNRIVEKYDTIYYIRDINTEGNLVQDGYTYEIFPLIKHGTFKTYYFNGNKASESQFDRNRFLGNIRWDINGNKAASNVIPPGYLEEEVKFMKKNFNEFRRFVFDNLRYPEEAAEQGITGRVIVSFTIFEDGSIHDIVFIQSAHKLLNKEMIRLLKNLRSIGRQVFMKARK